MNDHSRAVAAASVTVAGRPRRDRPRALPAAAVAGFRGPIVMAGGGLILAVKDGTIAGVSRTLRELLTRHVAAGTIPGGVALSGAGSAGVVRLGR